VNIGQLALVMFGLAVAVQPAAADARESAFGADWQRVASPAGQFSVLLPGAARGSEQSIAVGNRRLQWTVLKQAADSEQYALAYADLSATDLAAGADAIFAAIQTQLLPELQLQAIAENERSITRQGFPGREYLGSADGTTVAARFYLVGSRLYGLFARSADLAAIDYFFESFYARPVWREVAAEGFVAAFPEEPERETDTVTLGTTTQEWLAYKVKSPQAIAAPEPVSLAMADGSTYAIRPANRANYFAVAATELAAASDPAVLRRTALAALDQFGLSDLAASERAIAVGDTPGLAYSGVKGDRVVGVQFVVSGTRVYAVVAIAAEMAEVDWFLSSFALRP